MFILTAAENKIHIGHHSLQQEPHKSLYILHNSSSVIVVLDSKYYTHIYISKMDNHTVLQFVIPQYKYLTKPTIATDDKKAI